MSLTPADLQATFCATLVDEWARCGVQHAVVSPGSRSTPLMLALAAEPRMCLHVHHDERSAGFMAVGLALRAWEPTVVVTTSGTAAVELHPAVVEADLAAVPLLVCTADRPPELLDVGAPQAIDQTHLFGRSVRWFHAPGIADAAAQPSWRALAGRAYAEATGPRQGPVHLNLAFREPLVGSPAELPPGRGDGAPWVVQPPAQAPVDAGITAAGDLAGRRGVLLAGPGSRDGALVHQVATALGWPVLAAPQAPVWGIPGATIPAADAFLRTDVAHELQAEVVVRLGGPLASRVVGEWVAMTAADEIVVAGPQAWIDPHGTASVILPGDPADLLAAWSRELEGVTPVDDGRWLRRWQDIGVLAQSAIEQVLVEAGSASEPAVVGQVLGALPSGGGLVVSSSMPIRDLEWYGDPVPDLWIAANRGANGIDGVVSTAVGVAAASDAPTALLIGDVAFLHDSNGLLGAAHRRIDLVVVVLDNDGGGIFSFLPQSDVVDPTTFERVFGTPHGLDLVAVAESYGVRAQRPADLQGAVQAACAAGGVHVLVVGSNRKENVAVHRRLNEAVERALAR